MAVTPRNGMKKIFFYVFVPCLAFAFNFRPWLDPIFETQFRLGYTYQFYPSINTQFGNTPLKTKDHYFDASLEMRVSPSIEVGLFLSGLKTTRKDFFLDAFSALFKYQIFDDIIGDFASLTFFGQMVAPYKRSIKQFGRFYHSFFEGVLGLSLGKEFTKGPDFINRLWMASAIGIPNHGSVYAKNFFEWEWNVKNVMHVSIIANSYFGFGNSPLQNISLFDGYAHLRYRAVDLGAACKFLFGIYGDLSFSYLRRIYNKYAPRTNQFIFVYHLPFSLF
jgi:hypothetical protein